MNLTEEKYGWLGAPQAYISLKHEVRSLDPSSADWPR